MCILIDCILDRRDMFTSFSVGSHCIPHHAPLASQLLNLTQKVAKLDFERSCVERRVESRVEESCCERRFESRVERSVDPAGFSLTCETTTPTGFSLTRDTTIGSTAIGGS